MEWIPRIAALLIIAVVFGLIFNIGKMRDIIGKLGGKKK